MSKLAKLSLANRSLVALASIAVVLFGFFATASLKQELIPSLQLPVAVTMTTYPGASPEIVEREVTEPIESAISGVEGLERTTSTSSSGSSLVITEFTYGTDISRAVQDLQQSVNRISGQLPDQAEPLVQAGNFGDIPVMVLAVSANLDDSELARELDRLAVPELRGVAGVRDVQVTGVATPQVSVTLDQDELRKAGLTAESVTAALQANGVSIPGGNLTTDGKSFPVEVGTQFSGVDDIAALTLLPAAPVGPGTGQQGGQPGTGELDGEEGASGQAAQAPEPVRLGDVATVERSAPEQASLTRTDGEPSLGIMITKTPDGNTVDVARDVEELLPELEEQIGHGATFTTVFDQAPWIEESIEGLTTEGLLGLIFAVLVILVFLLSVRTTLVTAMSIPFSLLVAMIGLYTGGYSLNILTLGALTVAIGRVVDDSIVVLENIKRHIAYGEEKRHAILTAVREVAGAITASTVTTAGVFLPVAFVGGQTGELFRPFGVTVAIALLASLLVALTIIPVLAYWFVKPRTVAPEELAKAREEALAKERRNPLQRAYVPLIGWTTRHRVTTVLAGIAVFAGTIALAGQVQTNFLDDSGEESLTVTQKLPVGSSLSATDEAAQQVEDVLAEFDAIETYQVTVGSSGDAFFGPSGSNQAQFSITAEPDTDMAAFEEDLRTELDELSGAGELSIAGAAGFGMTDLEVLVEAGDIETLRTAAERVAEAVEDTPGATDVTNNLAADQPTVKVTPDPERAAALGLSDAQIGQAVRSVFEGQSPGSVVLAGETLDVVIRTDDGAPGSIAQLRRLPIATPTGQVVPLNRVATVERVSAPAQITHTDGARTASVTATPADASDLGTITSNLEDRLAEVELPPGASYSIVGVSAEQAESFEQLGMAMLAAIAIVFLVMVATFRSIVQPLILLVSVPFAATGAIGLLLLTDTALGVPALIGLLMLVGIVVTNAIVLIDLINQYRADGRSIREAVIEGGRQRLRPVLMTALATICALLPMAFGLTGGGVFISQPLAIVVIGGLVSSTLLTLVLVPTLYTSVETFKERRAEKRARRSARKAGTTAEARRRSGKAGEPADGPARADAQPAAQSPAQPSGTAKDRGPSRTVSDLPARAGAVAPNGTGRSGSHRAGQARPDGRNSGDDAQTVTARVTPGDSDGAHITVEVVVRNETG